MELDYTSGCICTSLLVDEEELIDLSRRKLIRLTKNILNRIDENEIRPLVGIFEFMVYDQDLDMDNNTFDKKLLEFKKESLQKQKKIIYNYIREKTDVIQELYISFMETYGKMKFLGKCEECGDLIFNWKITI